ncbi:MAG: hypothetical protein ACJ74Z_08900 [Bryobacteraceae bacterium]
MNNRTIRKQISVRRARTLDLATNLLDALNREMLGHPASLAARVIVSVNLSTGAFPSLLASFHPVTILVIGFRRIARLTSTAIKEVKPC